MKFDIIKFRIFVRSSNWFMIEKNGLIISSMNPSELLMTHEKFDLSDTRI